MNVDAAAFLLSKLMSTALLVCGPILFVALTVGVVISILQVVTQIQEMTLTFVPKMLAVAGVIMFFSNWMINLLTEFTEFSFHYASGL
ncbi:flagellar biosynthetic protein FliQ [Vibrio chagasii]|uniref:Flagellar biosynthetic protein FliQ n=1 Tax=Vibrio chagasii TaxID=170679 RepID=A0A7V7NPZ3_9VIBR|nr:flagellar biosynthetic protein FliQ [Vibrio chagasii]KAB0470267.1 flagellar biosynthetic protein FliQ [Vibrio chagasii]